MAEANEVLNSYGFEEVAPSVWEFSREVDGLAGVGKIGVVFRQLESGYWKLIGDREETAAPFMNFDSFSVADVVALAQNEVAELISSRYPAVNNEEGFTADGFFVTAPFMEAPYFSYGNVSWETDGKTQYRLKNPEEIWGAAYVEWREGFVERVVSGDFVKFEDYFAPEAAPAATPAP